MISVLDVVPVADVISVVDVVSSVELSDEVVLVKDEALSVVLDGMFSVLEVPEREDTDGRQGPAMLLLNSDAAAMKP